MSATALLQLVNFSKFRGAADDDWVDRLNHLYTVFLFVLFSVVATASALVGNPIACLTPANFPGTYIEYVKTYCWVKNTYYIPMDQSLPQDVVRRESEELTYYQWVPFILLFMACFFKLPCFLWRAFNQASGMNVDKMNEMTSSLSIMSSAKRREGVQQLAFCIDNWLTAHLHQQHTNAFARLCQRLCRLLCVFSKKRDYSYLTLLYVFVKFLYVANVVGQFFLVNAFVGGWYGLYGIEVLRGLFTDGKWPESPRFPPITLCDFDVRQMENIQRYTVQCALPINIFNDKIFVFIWFWLVWVALVNSISFLFWLWRAFDRRNHMAYIQKYLTIRNRLKEEEDKKFLRTFVQKYLRDDGIFLLRMLAHNANIVMLSLVIAELWDQYKMTQAASSTVSATSTSDVQRSASCRRQLPASEPEEAVQLFTEV